MANQNDKAQTAAAGATGTAAGTSKAMGQTAATAGEAMTRQAATAAQQMGQSTAGVASEMGRTASGMASEMGRKGMAGMAEFTRMFSEMKMPGMPDMEALLSAHRRNLETFSTANRVALEGAQAVARRHMEIVQQNIAELSEGMRELTSPDSPQVKASRQAEMLKTAYERSVSHMQELSDLIQRANGEALQVLNQRFTEAMDEVKTLVAKSGSSKA
jgi:phasin family protein